MSTRGPMFRLEKDDKTKYFNYWNTKKKYGRRNVQEEKKNCWIIKWIQKRKIFNKL